ncbi:uncharacterized membrane protein YgaE (UPF0421/DUF939 family) [Geomicrobium halophilum]|uniref:Uncharacterized membrane protein YgaE (UPF0421/DUF939 family) n=1 Tax=Geomicrobium halophilum TaxID=549000 RepID=A0A841PPG0_9BACL|nr:aromatic acid exporter family protein [Geomicrobium halophilum]MBB6450629.1 uncharacterized membrane protein YgaE (UPF0421/DUF939 family) [Geomicrobium halophilum]
MRLGARIFKTGLAIILALYAANWVGLEPSFFAGLTAGLTIQPSIYRTYQRVLHQIQANLIGAVLAVIFGLTFGHEPFVIGVVAMISIAIILRLGLDSSTIPVTLVTIVIIMGNSPDENYLLFASSRFALIMLGVFSAFIVNLVFLPPKYESKLYDQIFNTTVNAARWIRLTTRHESNIQSRREDLEESNDKLVDMDQLYLFFKEERSYLRRNKFAKARKVVLFREMLTATKKLMGILNRLDQHENEFYNLPDQTQRLIQQQLDRLTNYHERILARYSGEVNTQMTGWMAEEVDEGNESLLELFKESYDHKKDGREEWLSLLLFVSYIIEYNEQLDHLDRLVDSFFNYHQDD